MVVDLEKRYENTCKFVQQSNMKKLDMDVLNLAFAIEIQILVSFGELELIKELTKQYTQIENQILGRNGVKIA
ncbi:hypothetical protein [Psychrobacillus vulpis]|uniref:Uncharacterized protein n=1 Tax=Psychrobacillus vulpis TaxID=2325572 RepID=A0A544TWJ4_9BACI|nr:hypothetical protein [Psychrobacillus vulpis]TQR21823.1 hypothetical protein FG384_02445 [Psychrobacillus vulpis]